MVRAAILAGVGVLALLAAGLAARYLLDVGGRDQSRAPTPAGEEVPGLELPTLPPPPPSAVAPTETPPLVATPARLRVEPPALDFAVSRVRHDQAANAVTRRLLLRNTGGEPLVIDTIVLVDNPSGTFSIQSDAAQACQSIAPGTSCELRISFAPGYAGNAGTQTRYAGSLLIDPAISGTGNDVRVGLSAVVQRFPVPAPPPSPPDADGPTARELALQRRRAGIAPGTRFTTALSLAPAPPTADLAAEAPAPAPPGRYDEPFSTALATPPVDRTRLLTPDNTVSAVTLDSMSSRIPGQVRAMIERSVYSSGAGADRRILLPKGTILIGRQGASVEPADARLAVVWTQAIRPDGVRLAFPAPLLGADSQGRAGLVGIVDTRFWERFGSAILVSLIETASDVVVARASDGDTDNTVVVATSNSASDLESVATGAVQQRLDLPPVIVIPSGTRITVFVQDDLYFPDYGRDHRMADPQAVRAIPGGVVRPETPPGTPGGAGGFAPGNDRTGSPDPRPTAPQPQNPPAGAAVSLPPPARVSNPVPAQVGIN